jgi:hypothetical protein
MFPDGERRTQRYSVSMTLPVPIFRQQMAALLRTASPVVEVLDHQGSVMDHHFRPGTNIPCPYLEQNCVLRIRQRSSLPVVGEGNLSVEDCHFLMHEFCQTAHEDRSDNGERLLIQWETARAVKRGTAIGDGTDLLSSPDGADLEEFLSTNMKSYEKEHALLVEGTFIQSLCDACPDFSF